MAAQDVDRTAQVRIQLSSQTPDLELPESTGPILVSAELRRYQLSTLVNRLLSTEKPIPFEFVINGTVLRTSLDDYLTENGISAETTLQVEYVRAQIPPQQVASFQHDDWVSSVDVLSSTSPAGQAPTFSNDPSSERILSASYDGLLRTWSTSGTCIATSPAAHTGPIKSAKFLSPTTIASASLDRTVRIWSYTEPSPTSGTFTPTLELYGHTASVDSLAVDIPSQKILSASADHTVCLFSSSASSLPPAPANLLPPPSSKRRKLSTTSSSIPKRGALTTLTSHSAPVSAVAFAPTDHTVAYSTSWDHTLKTWDLPTGTCVDTRTTSHALLSVLPLASGLVAAGTSARHIALIDPRADARVVVPMTLRGHGNAVVSLARKPGDENVVVSGGHDGVLRVWDVRMGKGAVGVEEVGGGGGRVGEALYVLGDAEGNRKKVGGEGVKVFGVAWDEKVGVVAGGEGKRVDVYQG